MTGHPTHQQPSLHSVIRALGLTTLVACGVLLLAERAACLCLQFVRFPNSYTDARNTRGDLNWVEYTRPRPKRPNERRIILISNSQGYGREMLDTSLIYPKQLERLLNARDPRHTYTVANWSMDGGGGPEMVVLTARAVQHHPDAILLIAYSENFTDKRSRRPLSYAKSEVQSLAYVGEVRRRLSPWFVETFQVTRPIGWLSARSGLIRCRESFIEPGRPIQFGKAHFGKVRKLRSWKGRGTELLEEAYRAASQAKGARFVIVGMPLNEQGFSASTMPRAQGYIDAARTVLASKPGTAVLDATHLFPPEQFLTPDHFTANGHRAFAEWLADQLNQPQLAMMSGGVDGI